MRSHRKKTHPHTTSPIPKRTVRIDANTLVEVSMDISDEEARERYFNRHTPLRERNIPPLPKKKELDAEEILPEEVVLEEITEPDEDEE